MFNWHTMSVVPDLKMLGDNIRNVDYIVVAAITTGTYPENLPNVHYAGILIPPTEMMMEWVDGDTFVLQNEYPKYLMEQEPDEMIVALIAAMTRRNVVLYIPDEEFQVFGQLLLNHIYYMYGITCNTPWTTFAVDPNKIPLIMTKFYLMNVMDAKDYLDGYPGNYQIPDQAIYKLAQELHPLGPNAQATFEQYKQYFNQLNASKLKQKILMTRAVDPKEKK